MSVNSVGPGWRMPSVAALMGMLLVCSCGGGKAEQARDPSAEADRLEGTWDLNLRLERAMSLSPTAAPLPFTVRGAVTMMANRRTDVSFPSISQPTQIGVYQLALDSLGLARWEEGEVPGLAAREMRPAAHPRGDQPDSVVIVLNPSIPTREIRLMGVFDGPDVRGAWTAESPLVSGRSCVLLTPHQASDVRPLLPCASTSRRAVPWSRTTRQAPVPAATPPAAQPAPSRTDTRGSRRARRRAPRSTGGALRWARPEAVFPCNGLVSPLSTAHALPTRMRAIVTRAAVSRSRATESPLGMWPQLTPRVHVA